jgi:acetyltransferase-like isoleucine patch superfamily enzyme
VALSVRDLKPDPISSSPEGELLSRPSLKIVTNANVRKLLSDRRIFSSINADGWGLGEHFFVAPDARLEPYCHVLSGNVLPKAMGAFSYAFTRLSTDIEVGRYCSIAREVHVMGSSHPDAWASSHPFSHNPAPLRGVKTYLNDMGLPDIPIWDFERGDQSIYIGHDVWIGAETMIKRGVTIGHGAIVGTRSLVTKDVPPYAIVGGLPAKIIRYRFNEAIIQGLLTSQWWRYGPDVLQALDIRQPEAFLDRLADKEARNEISPLDLKPLSTAEIVRAVRAG